MSDTFSKVEVITGVARRRRFPTEQKWAVVAETMQPGQPLELRTRSSSRRTSGMSISYVARRHGLSPSLVVRADDDVVTASEVRRLEERVSLEAADE
jgi:transposase